MPAVFRDGDQRSIDIVEQQSAAPEVPMQHHVQCAAGIRDIAAQPGADLNLCLLRWRNRGSPLHRAGPSHPCHRFLRRELPAFADLPFDVRIRVSRVLHRATVGEPPWLAIRVAPEDAMKEMPKKYWRNMPE